jgi:5-methylcytosine-specific restriction endonuclease McrA
MVDQELKKKCNRGKDCVSPNGALQSINNFSKRRASPDGLAYSCKFCERKVALESYHRRKEQGKLEKTEEQKEMERQYSRDYYKATREDRLKYYQEYRATRRGRQVQREGTRRRAARMKEQKGDAPYQRWEVVKKDTIDGVLLCGICRKPIERVRDMHLDHIIPIAMGGPDVLDNVRCVHKECNLKRPKGDTGENVERAQSLPLVSEEDKVGSDILLSGASGGDSEEGK